MIAKVKRMPLLSRRSCAQPVVDPSPPVPGSLVHEILNYPKPSKQCRVRPFIPIQNWKNCKNSMSEELWEKHIEWEKQNSVETNSVSNVSTLKIDKTPLFKMVDTYFSKGVSPPVDEYVICLKKAGYSEHILKKVIIQDVEKERNKNKNDIEIIFGKFSKKGPSKPKKLSHLESLSKKIKKRK